MDSGRVKPCAVAPAGGSVGHLVDRHPTVSPERLVAQLVVPPTFTDVSFESYRPDPAEPTQAAAVQACLSFCEEAVRRRAGRRMECRDRR